MNKVKVIDEYFIDLLDKHKESKRDKREEKGFELVDKRPDWATDDNIWNKEGLNYARKIEGWEKLCIEAFLCGWIDFFDIQVANVPEEGDGARTIYFEWEKEKKPASLKVYFKPDPTNWPGGIPKPPLPMMAPAPPSPTIPKPPPPPLG